MIIFSTPVDTVSAKLSLAVQAQAAGVPIISAMGAGNKLDGSRFRISDISETRVCPLARVMRRELKKRGVRRLKVVWSDEQPTRPLEDMANSCRYHCICPPAPHISARIAAISPAARPLCRRSSAF